LILYLWKPRSYPKPYGYTHTTFADNARTHTLHLG
jgi:hypothetical protein